MERGLNVTNCDGSRATISLPSEIYVDNLPAGFEPNGPLPILHLDLITCKKISIDGVDAGAASLQTLQLSIKEPAGAPNGTHEGSWFVFETRTDNAALASWISNDLLKASSGTVVSRFTPQPAPSDRGELDGKATANGTTIYHINGYPYAEFVQRQYFARWFFGPNVDKDFWDVSKISDGSLGDGAGAVESTTDSKLAELTGGPFDAPALVGAEKVHYKIFEKP